MGNCRTWITACGQGRSVHSECACVPASMYTHSCLCEIVTLCMVQKMETFKNISTVHPGAKVRVITREARYYAKTRAFASFYAIISRAHAARAVT